jgi:hypothetical protein
VPATSTLWLLARVSYLRSRWGLTVLSAPATNIQLGLLLHRRRDDGFERWQAGLGCNGFCSEVLGIHFIFTQLVTDSHSIQKASRIGFLCHGIPILGSIRSEKDRPSQHFNNRERRTHRTSEDWTYSSLLLVP